MGPRKVFLSYSHRDAQWAREFARALDDRGFRVWIDQFRLQAGEPVREALEKGLRESDMLVALIDPSSTRAPSLLFELGAAIGMGKRVVAVVPSDVDVSQLPQSLRVRRYVIKDTPDATAERLLTAEEEPSAQG
jgi:nucleoside 2-deoxyribosyltransferase